ncbi:hypothetical protein CRG98_022646 [Punica granatum]|uniref:Uncharacterized protein n=1 Tax=Punica granatum TaxID=22663 RepID=A0A2I0JL24_PUNGR|nr:hypothetical protein CRG98_022646 [Punica granatum]
MPSLCLESWRYRLRYQSVEQWAVNCCRVGEVADNLESKAASHFAPYLLGEDEGTTSTGNEKRSPGMKGRRRVATTSGTPSNTFSVSDNLLLRGQQMVSGYGG